LPSCGKTSLTRDPASPTRSIRVLAASSLTEAFTALAHDFERTHPEAKVETEFAGSTTLDAQIVGGVPADVFASADAVSMQRVAAFTGTPLAFARNTMEIAVERGNPKHIASLSSLANSKLLYSVCDAAVPCGKLAARILKRVHIGTSPISKESNVKGVVTTIATGNADWGIVYVTDVLAAKGSIDGVPIPAARNATTTYEIAPLRTWRNEPLAGAFISYVRGANGQAILGRLGFLPPG